MLRNVVPILVYCYRVGGRIETLFKALYKKKRNTRFRTVFFESMRAVGSIYFRIYFGYIYLSPLHFASAIYTVLLKNGEGGKYARKTRMRPSHKSWA